MANRTTNPLSTPRTDAHALYATLIGGGVGVTMTMGAQEALNGEITSVAWSSTGTYTVVFRHKYPELKSAPGFRFVGATDGFNGRCSAIDVAAGTATFVFNVSTTLTDVPTTTTVYIDWVCRNSVKNP
jgi:hypothetical protein